MFDIQNAGLWAIRESLLRSMVASLSPRTLVARRRPAYLRPEPSYVRSEGGVAVIELGGVLTKYGDSFFGGTSTRDVRTLVRAAMQDDHVKAILLLVDSPGGQIAGVRDLADTVAAAARQKPVDAYIEDMAASAAYWVASQVRKVYANATAFIGGVGIYAVLTDASEMAKKGGVKVHVVRAGEFKGVGTPGTAITDPHLAEMQRIVSAVNGHFLEALARGRRLSGANLEAAADGRVHIGENARRFGLIDRVASFDEVLESLAQETKTKGKSQ